MRATRPLLLGFLLMSGCAAEESTPSAAPATVTVTVTETVVATPTSETMPSPMGQPTTAPAPPPPSIGLQVHTDGCGLIREDVDIEDYPNLGWSIVDADGFQVLQRNARGETHYRYFQGGNYTAVLTAWDGDKYVPVSDEVAITC